MSGSFQWVLGQGRSDSSKALNQLCGTMARAAQRDVSHGQGSLGRQRRARAAGIRISNHTFRAIGITAYLRNGGTLEKAALIANHASPRTTQLYDRRNDEVSLDEVECILI